MNVELLRRETMHFLRDCRGRDKAIPRAELEHHLRLWEPGLPERTVRRIYAGLPICSCSEGLFVPRTVREVLEFKEYVTKAHGPFIAARRCETIYSIYPNLRPIAEVQRELF